jgi:hypothetical protein
MIETSESTAKLDAALAKAQGEFAAAIKDSNNPAFKSKYADLTAVMEAIRPALTKHGISLTQWPVHSTDNRVHMVTRIAHDGEWIRGTFSMPCDKQNAHGYGSIVSYLRRYCVSSCLGVVTDLDDDGNAASGRSDQPAPPPVMLAAGGTPGASKAAQRDTFSKLVKAIRQASSVTTLKAWYQQNVTEIDALHPDFLDELRVEYNDRLSELKASVAA